MQSNSNNHNNNVDHLITLVEGMSSSVKQELGTIKSELVSVKEEVGTIKSELVSVKEEVGTIKSDMVTKSEFNSVKQEIDTIKSDMVTKSEFNNVKKTIEIIRSELGLHSESLINNQVQKLYGSKMGESRKINNLYDLSAIFVTTETTTQTDFNKLIKYVGLIAQNLIVKETVKKILEEILNKFEKDEIIRTDDFFSFEKTQQQKEEILKTIEARIKANKDHFKNTQNVYSLLNGIKIYSFGNFQERKEFLSDSSFGLFCTIYESLNVDIHKSFDEIPFSLEIDCYGYSTINKHAVTIKQGEIKSHLGLAEQAHKQLSQLHKIYKYLCGIIFPEKEFVYEGYFFYHSKSSKIHDHSVNKSLDENEFNFQQIPL